MQESTAAGPEPAFEALGSSKRCRAEEETRPITAGTLSNPTQGGYVSLHEAFDKLVEHSGGSPAVDDELGVTWSYLELQKASLQVAHHLLHHLKRSDTCSSHPPVVATLMQRRSAWVAACLAAARLGTPLLALSGDLKSADEEKRNEEALAEHLPAVVVLDAALRGSRAAASVLAAGSVKGGPVILDADSLLQSNGPLAQVPSNHWGPRHADDVLYLVYTGGTTSASKCIATTHRMALFELETYPRISPLSATDRVLHQSSAYWGATSLGIFDLAWAFGACLVMAEGGSGPAVVTRAIAERSVTVVGVVPSVLEALEWERCSTLRIVFTWGETLAPATAARWSRRVALLDLLIASEYWLILYADHRVSEGDNGSSCQAGFQPVPGARLTLRPPAEDSREESCNSVVGVADGEVGELYMAGPMVSAVGYTDSARNDGAFVSLPVGPSGVPLRHFRTRDLARKRADGSLEYCGRADGFAKVGGRWLDLAAVERSLLAAGCKEAALVWDEETKTRHAAVVLSTPGPASGKSIARQAAELEALLPRETRLHLLKELPHHATTGKVHRGALVKQLAAATPPPSCGRLTSATSTQPLQLLRRSLVWGLVLAASVGVKGATLLPFMWHLAPGVLKKNHQDLLQALPSGVARVARGWAGWYQSYVSTLRREELEALPFIVLLLLDTEATGLSTLVRLLSGPLGWLGASVLLCRITPPWLRQLWVSAATRLAQKKHRGDYWAWTFWFGLPFLSDQWVNDRWNAWPKGGVCAEDAGPAIRALLAELTQTLSEANTSRAEAEETPRSQSTAQLSANSSNVPWVPSGCKWLPELRKCENCWDWVSRGALWHGKLYCDECTSGWNYSKRQREDSRNSTPLQTPRALAAEEVGSAVSRMESCSSAGANDEEPPSKVPRLVIPSADLPAEAPRPDLVPKGENSVVSGGSASSWSRRPTVDDIAFTDSEVQAARGLAELKNGHGNRVARPPSSAVLSPIGRIVERCTGISISNPEEPSLTSLESLKVIVLVSTLRRELGIALAAGDVAQCNSLSDLERLCEASKPDSAPATGAAEHQGETADAEEWPIYAIPRFWKAPVGWLLQLTDLPNEDAMRLACRALTLRHAALRAVAPANQEQSFTALLCNEASAVLLVHRSLLLDGKTCGAFCTTAAEAMLKVWPRTAVSPHSVMSHADSHFEWHTYDTEPELRKAAWLRARSRGFEPPASIAVLVLMDEKEIRQVKMSFLHVAVNHAISDAASIVPMVTDLLELHRSAKHLFATKSLDDMTPEALLQHAGLPPARNGVELQSVRLREALLPSESQKGADSSADLGHSMYNPRRGGYDHYLRLQPSACQVLEAVSNILGVPMDHLLVVITAVAFGVCTGRREVKLSLIVPMRDGIGEGQSVGNLASTRHLSIWLHGDRSLAGIALDLSTRLRRREWILTDILGDDGDRLFMNVRGMPRFEGAIPVMEATDVTKNPSKIVRNMVELFADQEGPDRWTFWMGVRWDIDGSELARALQAALWGLATDPMQPLQLPEVELQS